MNFLQSFFEVQELFHNTDCSQGAALAGCVLACVHVRV